jgi:hypothetical protein
MVIGKLQEHALALVERRAGMIQHLLAVDPCLEEAIGICDHLT